jgi:hypothetical protein
MVAKIRRSWMSFPVAQRPRQWRREARLSWSCSREALQQCATALAHLFSLQFYPALAQIQGMARPINTILAHYLRAVTGAMPRPIRKLICGLSGKSTIRGRHHDYWMSALPGEPESSGACGRQAVAMCDLPTGVSGGPGSAPEECWGRLARIRHGESSQ